MCTAPTMITRTGVIEHVEKRAPGVGLEGAGAVRVQGLARGLDDRLPCARRTLERAQQLFLACLEIGGEDDRLRSLTSLQQGP